MKDILRMMNPWWDDGEVPKKRLGRHRPRFSDVLMAQTAKKAVSIVAGPRRCGKTTLLMQVIQNLIEKGTDPKRIFYAQMDHTSMPTEKPLDAVLSTFRSENAISRDEKIYIFLDEIQYVPEWARWVKGVYDLEDVKIFLSGSSASVLLPEAISYLAGRQLTTRVYPLSFSEYLDFTGKTPKARDSHLYPALFRQYLSTGGLPEAVLEEDRFSRNILLQHYLEDMVYKDVVKAYAVRDIQTLKGLVMLILSGMGQPISINKASRVLKVSPNTVRELLGHLESAYLIGSLEYYSTSRNERIYNPKKYYLLDTGIRTAALGHFDEGVSAECAIYNTLSSLSKDIFYWKSGKEVDFVIPELKMALESKFVDEIHGKDALGLVEFLDTHKGFTGRILTAKKHDSMRSGNRSIELIPAWDYLLSLEKT